MTRPRWSTLLLVAFCLGLGVPATIALTPGQDAVAAVTGGFVSWYLWGGLGLLAFTLVAAAGAVGMRTLIVLRKQSLAGDGHPPFGEIWAQCVHAALRMASSVVRLVVPAAR